MRNKIWIMIKEEYIINYRYFNELRDKNTALQNKIVITISSALFGIIITSLDKLLPLFDTFLNYFFIALVVANALTIYLILVSILFANKALEIAIDNAKAKYHQQKVEKNNQWKECAKKCQCAYLFSFGITIFIFAIMLIYIFLNSKG